MNVGETETLPIFSSAWKRFVPLDDDLVADYRTIRKVPVWTAKQHTTAIPSVV